MLKQLIHLWVYAYKWAYECNSVPICNDRKKFVGVRNHSWGARNFNIQIRMDVRSGVRIALQTTQECL